MHVAVRGEGAQALIAALCCATVADEVTLQDWQDEATTYALELPPNAWHVLTALGLRDALEPLVFYPLADLTRSAKSGYLLSQRPLRKFASERYGHAHACIESDKFVELLRAELAARNVVDTDLQPADVIASNTPHRDGEATPWRRLTYRLDRDPEERDQRFLTRWLAERTHICTLPTLDHRWMEVTTADESDPWAAELTREATLVREHQVTLAEPATHWFRGESVVFGAAAHGSLPITGLRLAFAAEDCWVLARMLDNYDDHLPTALTEYEKYRLARARKAHAYDVAALPSMLNASPADVIRRNLKLAFGSRFLPEMSMQKVDWLYGHNCVKGFN